MAKTISQETFNNVVKENMEEFDMTEEEAVVDAIQQFNAQGVNLGNIIKSPGKALNVESSVDQLLTLVKEVNLSEEKASNVIKGVAKATAGELSHKLLASSMGAYPALVTCLKNDNPEIQQEALKALISLMDGHPDLLDADGVELIVKGLGKEAAIAELTLQWVQVSVRKHEKNRASLIRNNIAQKLLNLTETYPKDVKIISGICSVIQVLILDDDVRVVHGDAHEHARTLANELLPLLTSTLPKFTLDVNVTWKLLEALTSMLVRNEFCITFHENDGIRHVIDAMQAHPKDEKVSRSGLLLFKNLAGSDEVREAIIAAGGAHPIITALETHYKNSGLAVAGCMCLAALTLRSPSNSLQLAAAGGPETLIHCLEHWKSNKSIMKHGCSAIRNQVSRCPELCEIYKNLELDELIGKAKNIHGDLGFEAKSVLLDLGCQVQLNEEWKGTGKNLQL